MGFEPIVHRFPCSLFHDSQCGTLNRYTVTNNLLYICKVCSIQVFLPHRLQISLPHKSRLHAIWPDHESQLHMKQIALQLNITCWHFSALYRCALEPNHGFYRNILYSNYRKKNSKWSGSLSREYFTRNSCNT